MEKNELNCKFKYKNHVWSQNSSISNLKLESILEKNQFYSQATKHAETQLFNVKFSF